MSQWTLVQTEMNDVECIKSAAEELGYTCQVFDKPQAFQNDDYISRKVDIIIKGKKLINPIGMTKKSSGGYEVIMSYSDRRKTFVDKLTQTYAARKLLKRAKQMGAMLSSKKTDAKGRIKIKLTVG